MKKIEISDKESTDLKPEYNFDYRRARPNRFAKRMSEGCTMVVLDPDIAKVFTTAESVNAVLRALIATMPNVVGVSDYKKISI